MSYILLVLILLFGWVFAMSVLNPFIKKSQHFQLMYGVLLLVKIRKNRNILTRLAKISDSKFFSRLSIPIVYILIILGTFLLVLGAILSFSIKQSLPLNEYLALPGINPEIPVTYGIVAFSLSVIIHEMFHGIVARKHDIDVTSVGVIFFIVPLGAFVEPEEKQITEVDPVVRRRIVAAGIAVNFIIAIFAFLIFSIALSHAAVQTEPGAYLDTVFPGSPLYNSSLSGYEITSIGNLHGNNVNNINSGITAMPGTLINVTMYDGHGYRNYTTPAGITVAATLQGFPAAQANVQNGSYIISIQNITIYNDAGLSSELNTIHPGTNITMVTEVFNSSGPHLIGTYHTYHFRTASIYSYYEKYDPSAANSTQKNGSFLGVNVVYSGLGIIPMSYMKSIIFGDFAYKSGFTGFMQSIALPLEGLNPVPSGFASLYTVPFGGSIFWPLANMLYWFFWVNILLAITNALPLAIFDGAQFFRDTLIINSKHESLKFLRNEKTLAKILSLATTFVFTMIMIEIIVPRII